jgi:hypothetical protein
LFARQQLGQRRLRHKQPLGRAGQMASHWPAATDEYAGFMNTLPKVVFSRSLPSAGWPGTRKKDLRRL